MASIGMPGGRMPNADLLMATLLLCVRHRTNNGSTALEKAVLGVDAVAAKVRLLPSSN